VFVPVAVVLVRVELVTLVKFSVVEV
jgi:hypothetical protein